MAFKSTTENGGERDPNISTTGRPKETRKLTKREQKDKELMLLVRKLKPHMSCTIETISDIMRGDKSSENGKLKACALFLTEYQKLIKEVYSNEAIGKDDEDEDDKPSAEDSAPAPVFSLKMVNN